MTNSTSGNHVIFLHPDGTSPSHYALARFVDKGPDGRLNWDMMSNSGVYLGHLEDQLGGTSNAGAVTHATGAKVYAESFGLNADNSQVTPLSGNTGKTIIEEAIAIADSEPSAPFINVNPTTTNTNRAVLDGVNGSTGSAEAPWRPFAAQDSIDGPMGNFGIAWVGTPDFPGSIVSKTYGMNADKLPSTLDNTEIYALMYQTLFGVTPQFAAAQQETQFIYGTTGNDIFIAGAAGSSFDGINDTLFTGAGNDEVDTRTVTSPIAGRNRIDLGSGNDIVFVSKSDYVFGGNGNDVFDATNAQGNNRMSGDAGDDIFFLGSNDRALGGDGNDQFYVQLRGDNLLSGGAGADQFWITNAELPSKANTILDFQVGTDVIGIPGSAGLGISASTLTLSQFGNDTQIGFGGQTLAVLSGIQATSLNLNNTSQFVFV